MRRTLGLAVAVFLAGCGPADPGARLEAGSKVLLVSTTGERSSVYVRSPNGVIEVPGGTLATVARDAGPEADRNRKVAVHVEDGRRAGEAGEVSRLDCQPVSR